MATKNNPGKYDCYQNARPDEPLFTLLARDASASYFVAAWAALRVGDLETAHKCIDRAYQALMAVGKVSGSRSDEKIAEAEVCSKAMFEYHLECRIEHAEKRLGIDPPA